MFVTLITVQIPRDQTNCSLLYLVHFWIDINLRRKPI